MTSTTLRHKNVLDNEQHMNECTSDYSPTLSVVVPVYHSAQTLRKLYSRITLAIEPIARDFEPILVEDCGGDGSWDIIQRIAEKDGRVRGIRLSRNYGQHNALLCGIRKARGDVIITMDDDLQHPPEEIPKLLKKLSEGYDVVYGSPQSLPHGFFRNLASIITKWALQSAMGAKNAREVSAFRAFRTDVRKAFENYHSPLVCIDVLLTWGTTNFGYVKVAHHPRKAGVSGYTLRKLITHAVNMLTGFSVLPLQLASLIGLAFTAFGFVILCYVLFRYGSSLTDLWGILFKGEEIRKGGGGVDRETVRGFSPMSGRLPGIAEKKAVEGRGEMPLLRFFENLGGWLHSEKGQEV